MFLSLILSFFSYKYQRTNKIQNERYFHHRYLSFYFNLSLMIFRTVYRYLTFIRLSFTDDTTYLLSISYLHPYLISLTYLCFLTDIFIVPLECTDRATRVKRSVHPSGTITIELISHDLIRQITQEYRVVYLKSKATSPLLSQ